MFNTYKLLKLQTREDLKNHTNEELALMYQRTGDQTIIAELFCKNFAFWLTRSQSIQIISQEDRVSIILKNIEYGARTYSFKYGASLMTYIYKGIQNDFGAYKIKYKHKDRVCEYQILDLDTPVCEGGTLNDIIPDESNQLAEAMLKLTIETDNTLDQREKKMCNIFIDNPYTDIHELSRQLGVGTQRAWFLKKLLAKKLKISLCIED